MLKHILLLALSTWVARAELSTSHYRQLQTEAPEAIQVTVEQVETKVTLGKDGTATEVTATAIVQSVTRSASGLKPAAKITIRYNVVRPVVPMPGPSPLPVLTQGPTVAFLKKDAEGNYRPAAYGMSFTRL
jgi:hypothetical protein